VIHIAQANALSSDNDLSLGQRLQIPTVTTHSNTAATVKPYDPGSIVGSTTPSLPTIAPTPPLSSHHCNVLAEIVVIAVQLVVTSALGPIAGSIAGQLTVDALGVHQANKGVTISTPGSIGTQKPVSDSYRRS